MPSPVRYAEIKRLLEAKGYTLDRVNGSHHIFIKPGVRSLSIPVHKNEVKHAYYRQAQKAG